MRQTSCGRKQALAERSPGRSTVGRPRTSQPTAPARWTESSLTSRGSSGPHTLVLSWISGKSNIDGVIEYASDYSRGIQVHDAGHYGWQSSNWVSALNGGAASGPAGGIAALAPAAVIIGLGSSDQFSGVPPATFQSRLQAVISAIQARLASRFPCSC